LPSSIKAMRHAVNVSESGSIPEAAAISKPLHLGWNRTVDPVSDEFESRWRRQNRPSCGLLHDVTATTGYVLPSGARCKYRAWSMYLPEPLGRWRVLHTCWSRFNPDIGYQSMGCANKERWPLVWL